MTLDIDNSFSDENIINRFTEIRDKSFPSCRKTKLRFDNTRAFLIYRFPIRNIIYLNNSKINSIPLNENSLDGLVAYGLSSQLSYSIRNLYGKGEYLWQTYMTNKNKVLDEACLIAISKGYGNRIISLLDVLDYMHSEFSAHSVTRKSDTVYANRIREMADMGSMKYLNKMEAENSLPPQEIVDLIMCNMFGDINEFRSKKKKNSTFLCL